MIEREKAMAEKNNARWKTAAAVALLLLALASVSSCGGREKSAGPAPEAVSGVMVATARLETVPDEVEAPGTVTGAATAEVSARTMGTVVRVAVREGDMVEAGQALVLLDERELAARGSAARAAVAEARAAREEVEKGVAAAAAQAEVAKKTLDRYAFLREQKSVSAQEFDEVNARNTAAQAQLAAARAKQQQVEAMHSRAEAESRAAETVAGYARVTAPFSGVVVRRSVEPGQMAAPGVPLLTLEDNRNFRLEVTLDAASAATVKRGTRARVRLDALGERALEGAVVELEAGAAAGSQTVRARVELPRDAAIRSGLFGRAWFRRGETQAIALPAGAILHRGQLHGVYAVNGEGIARLRLVTRGRTFPDGQVEILSGLESGESYVKNPGSRELDGRKVK
jgi:RND family efflux transporter MFP subunit